MSRRKLEALKYPLQECLNLTDLNTFRNLVVWLEDQKIRLYKVEEREGLRNIESPDWPNTFDNYLEALGISNQINKNSLNEIIEALLTLAVRLEYSDNAKNYSHSSGMSEQEGDSPQVVTVNPLDQLDFSSQEFVDGVNKLADALQVTKHPNHLITLQAIATLVKTRMSNKCLQNLDGIKPMGKPFPIKEVDMGLESGDYILNSASKILRLLYIHDLRDLQTKINECIVALQIVTANPKTDTKLGKVGF